MAPTTQPTAPPAEVRSARRRLTRLRDDRWPERFAAWLFAYSGLVVVASLMPDLRQALSRPNDVLSSLTIPVVPNLVYAATLFSLAIGLRRRLRAAWWLGVLWLLVLPEAFRALAVVRGSASLAEVVGLVGMGAVLLTAMRAKHQFVARAIRGNLAGALALFLVGGLATVAIGGLLVQEFGTAPDLGTASAWVLDRILGDIGLVTSTAPVHAALWVQAIVGLLGAATVLGSTYLLLRAPHFTRFLEASEDARVRALLHEFGDVDSLGYFATRRDKAVAWDDDEDPRAGVSYRVFGSVSLASGNPVGDPTRWAGAIERWRALARANGWSLAVMGAGEQGARAYDAAGLVAFEIGDEAIVDLRSFSLSGPGMRPVRQAVHRLLRRGFTTRVSRFGALAGGRFAELESAAARWRGDGGDERGFSMALGRLGDPLDGACVLVEARDAQGVLRAFLSFVPWGGAGLSLDLMRRDPDSDNGLVELMVASLAEQAGSLGVARASLNFAMFREAFERGAQLGAGPLARVWRGALVLASRNWQLESLYRSNAKYLPAWQARYICFEYASDLPRIAAAAGNAEGFLGRSSLTRRWRGGGDQRVGRLGRSGSEYASAVLAQVPPQPLATAASTQHRTTEQERVRREKVDRLRARGIDPYPVGYPRTHTLAAVRQLAGEPPSGGRTGITASVTGRVLLKRDLGRLCFATLRDASGDLQVMLDLAGVGGEVLEHWIRDIDIGDHVGVTGEVIATRRGELTLHAESFALTSKALRPLPDKRRGLTDPEARVRARQVDLIVRPRAREVAHLRSAVMSSIRESLQRSGFVEVETPTLQLTHGGANARPFETHINAYDLDLYLRIATELHLKRLVVGGIERVFEIGKQFRNEGADVKHNPEFTSLEVYEAYGDYDTMRRLAQELVQAAAQAAFGAPVARHVGPDGVVTEHDLSGDWPVKPLTQAVSEALGEAVTLDTPTEELRRHAARIGLALDGDASWGVVLEKLYGELCERSTTAPVFYTDFPKDNAPLARSHREHPLLAEKWDLVMFGAELATAYSELTDPIEQRQRLVAQSLLAAAGDVEAMVLDEDFVAALEQGMPPTGGMGMGIDRLVMNLTGLGIRDTILFPLVKPHGR